MSLPSPSLVVHEDGKEVLYAVKSSCRGLRLVRFRNRKPAEETVCLWDTSIPPECFGPFLFGRG